MNKLLKYNKRSYDKKKKKKKKKKDICILIFCEKFKNIIFKKLLYLKMKMMKVN